MRGTRYVGFARMREYLLSARFISNDPTRASSSLVVKVEKATRFKNSFRPREATDHRVRSVNYWSESGFVREFDVFEILSYIARKRE